LSVKITNDCINCSACETECPTGAVLPRLKDPGNRSLFINNNFLAKSWASYDHYFINPYTCNDCEGFYTSPRCNKVCPVSCCIAEEEAETHGSQMVKIKINPVYITKISLN
jgi:ferredoxin